MPRVLAAKEAQSLGSNLRARTSKSRTRITMVPPRPRPRPREHRGEGSPSTHPPAQTVRPPPRREPGSVGASVSVRRPEPGAEEQNRRSNLSAREAQRAASRSPSRTDEETRTRAGELRKECRAAPAGACGGLRGASARRLQSRWKLSGAFRGGPRLGLPGGPAVRGAEAVDGGQAVRRAALGRRPWRRLWGRGGRRGACWRRCGVGTPASRPW